MRTEDPVALAAQAIVRRAEERFQAHRLEIVTWTDRFFSRLMVGQWLFGIFFALVLSPYAWEGKVTTVHVNVWLAVFLRLAISALTIELAVLRLWCVVERHCIAA